VHPGNDRLRHAGEGEHHLGALLEQPLHVGLAVIGAHFLQVMAGAERLAGTGQHHHAHRLIGGDGVEFLLQRAQQRFRERIELAGAVQGEGGQAVGAVGAQQEAVVVIHVVSLMGYR